MDNLSSLMQEPGQLQFPGIIKPEGKKSDVLGKTFPVMLPGTVEDRIQKYFEFCRAWDKREDPYLRDEYQMFSHRLIWAEHPFVDAIQTVKSFRDKVWFTLIFSFTNEHWQTFYSAVEGGEEGLRSRLASPDVRVQRHDLFQIYYPKGTKIREWIIDGTKAAADAVSDKIRGRNRPWGMMQVAYILNDFFRSKQGFSTALYPSKNFARYLSMGFPNIVNPDSYVHPGTGSCRGLHQIFGGQYLMAKAKFEIDDDTGQMLPENDAAEELRYQFTVLCAHRDNPIKVHRQMNHEDKCCFLFKRLCLETGVQKPTPRIPYDWIFPLDFSLKKPT